MTMSLKEYLQQGAPLPIRQEVRTMETDDLREHEADLERVRALARAERAALFFPNGDPKHSPEVMTAQQEQIAQAERIGLRTVSERLQAIITDATDQIAAVEAVDPTAQFGRETIEKITLRTPILLADLKTASGPVRARRFKAAIESTDKAERYAYLQAGRALLTEEEAVPQYANGRPLPRGLGSELGQFVAELEASFVDNAKRQRAETRLAAAERIATGLALDQFLSNRYGERPAATTPQRSATAGR